MAFVLPRQATPEDPLRLAVLISGSGSGMEALLRHQSMGCTHKTSVVISNKSGVKGLDRASKHGVPAEVIEVPITPSPQDSRLAHEELLHERLCELDIEAVILSGYMRILSQWFVERWEGRLLNIHPSLLPRYPGAHAHRDVLAAGESISGCTVHFVDTGMDSGRIIAQRKVMVEPDDDEDSLAQRVKQVEHILYPSIIDDFASGRLE